MEKSKDIPLHADLADHGGCANSEPFALRVLGDSMEPEFRDGCIVIIDSAAAVESGSYVLAMVNGEYIFRQLIIENEQYILKPPCRNKTMRNGSDKTTAFQWHRDYDSVKDKCRNSLYPYVSVWIALNDMTLNNGCLFILTKHLERDFNREIFSKRKQEQEDEIETEEEPSDDDGDDKGGGGNPPAAAPRTTPRLGGNGNLWNANLPANAVTFDSQQGIDASNDPGVDFSFNDIYKNYSVFDGTVVEVGNGLYGAGYGGVVVIRSKDPNDPTKEFDALYAHFAPGTQAVVEGQSIKAGDYIGPVGWVGQWPGGHPAPGAGGMTGPHTSLDFFEPNDKRGQITGPYSGKSGLQQYVLNLAGKTPSSSVSGPIVPPPPKQKIGPGSEPGGGKGGNPPPYRGIGGYGLRPDGTSGMNKVGDTIKGHDGKDYKLVPRKGYGYNQWVPVKLAMGMNPMVGRGRGIGGPKPTTRREQALLDTISFAEGTTSSYGTIFGGKVIPELANGDLTVKEVYDMMMTGEVRGRKAGYASGSYATGRYQFMPATIKDVVEKYKVLKWSDKFTRAAQDRAILSRMDHQRGVTDALLRKEGLSNKVLDMLSGEFASFPTYEGRSLYDQPVKSQEKLRQIYNNHLNATPRTRQEIEEQIRRNEADKLRYKNRPDLFFGSNPSTPDSLYANSSMAEDMEETMVQQVYIINTTVASNDDTPIITSSGKSSVDYVDQYRMAVLGA